MVIDERRGNTRYGRANLRLLYGAELLTLACALAATSNGLESLNWRLSDTSEISCRCNAKINSFYSLTDISTTFPMVTTVIHRVKHSPSFRFVYVSI